MEKISIKLDPSLLKKMQERMSRNGGQSISQCVRELIELALKIEELSSKDDAAKGENDIDFTIIELLKRNAEWVLETRLLMRYLVKTKGDDPEKNIEVVLNFAKERSLEIVEEVFGNTSSGNA